MDKKALDIINEYQSFTPEQIKENTSKIIENIEDPEVKSLVISFVIFTGMNSRNPTVRELIEFNSSQRSLIILKEKVTNLVNKYRTHTIQQIQENANRLYFDIQDEEEKKLFHEFLMYVNIHDRIPSVNELIQQHNNHKGGKRRRLRKSKRRRSKKLRRRRGTRRK